MGEEAERPARPAEATSPAEAATSPAGDPVSRGASSSSAGSSSKRRSHSRPRCRRSRSRSRSRWSRSRRSRRSRSRNRRSRSSTSRSRSRSRHLASSVAGCTTSMPEEEEEQLSDGELRARLYENHYREALPAGRLYAHPVPKKPRRLQAPVPAGLLTPGRNSKAKAAPAKAKPKSWAKINPPPPPVRPRQ